MREIITFCYPPGLTQRARPVLYAAAVVLALFSVSAGAQSPAPSSGSNESDAPKPEIQPQAVTALDKLGAYLRTLKSFRIDADSITDAILSTGQNVGFLHHTVLEVQRPNKVRALIGGSGAPKGMVYDGHTNDQPETLIGYRPIPN